MSGATAKSQNNLCKYGINLNILIAEKAQSLTREQMQSAGYSRDIRYVSIK